MSNWNQTENDIQTSQIPMSSSTELEGFEYCYEEPMSILKKIAMRDLDGDLFYRIYDSAAKDYTCCSDERYKGIDFSKIAKTLAKIINRMVLDDEDVLNLKKINILITPTRIKRTSTINEEKKSERVPGSFVVLSDFHAHEFPIDKIEDYYLNEYDCIYILGDATDRGEDGLGTNGIEYLLRIKKLTEKYPGRIIYVPGNHDKFIIDYARGFQYSDEHLKENEGKATIDDLDKLRNEKPEIYNDLIDWLGNLPIQRVHEFNGQKYVLAHALFKQSIYDENPNFCLNDINSAKDQQSYDEGMQVIWFRKGQKGFYSDYDSQKMPSSNCIMVIGHTPPYSRNVISLNGDVEFNFDLRGADGGTIKVHCVDGGIYYSRNTIKKYDGGSQTHDTEVGFHRDTSPKSHDDFYSEQELDYKRTIYHDYIIGKVFEHLRTKQPYFAFSNIGFPQELSEEDIYQIIEEYGIEMKGHLGFAWPTANFKDRKAFYEQIFLFDYIINYILQRATDVVWKRHAGDIMSNNITSQDYDRMVMSMLDKWLDDIIFRVICGREEQEEAYILDRIASVITDEQLKEILGAHHCFSGGLGMMYEKYVTYKFFESSSPRYFGH